MIPNLFRSSRKAKALKAYAAQLADARQVRDRARAVAAAAHARGDDRDYGRAQMVVQQATHDVLALELAAHTVGGRA